MKIKNVIEHEAIENIKRLLTPVKKQTRMHKEKTPEQTEAMFERMAKMRIRLNETRQNKREFKEKNGTDLIDTRILTKTPINIEKPTHNQEFILFEQNYNSKIEKIDVAMTSINDTLREMNERKREKYLKKDLLIKAQEQAKAQNTQADHKQSQNTQAQAQNTQAQAHNTQTQAQNTQAQAQNTQAQAQAQNTHAQVQAQAQAHNKQSYTNTQLPNPNRYMKRPIF